MAPMAATRGAHRRVVPLCRAVLAGKEVGRALSSGSGSARDADMEALFANVPSSTSSAAKASSGESNFWKSLVGEPSSSSSSRTEVEDKWGFLKDINMSYPPRSSRPLPQKSFSSGSSFRNLRDQGIDFLREDLERPTTTLSEPAEQQEFGEESLLKSASFKLLRDSFQKVSMQPAGGETVGIKSTLQEAMGLDPSLFSSSETWSKPVDSRSLAEVEGNFYSTMDQSPAEDIKTYTYEELGEKLRQARPPTEEMLSSATGLSFGELRTRFQKIEQMENGGKENKDDRTDYEELRDSLNQLKPIGPMKSATKQLSYEELTFLNQSGVRTGFCEKIEYTPPKDDLLTKYYSDAQLSSKERLKLKIKKLREEFQTHDCDSGSPQVQIAILTARINNLIRHLREEPNYKRDKHSKKGLNDMVQYRKRLLRYLRRRDWPVYCNVLTKLKLDDVILEKQR